jgi:hypothetical protein
MPLYEITLEQLYAGQQCVNRWTYQSNEVPSGVSGAFKALVGMGFTPDTDIPAFGGNTIAAKLQAVQSIGVTFVQAIAKNLYSNADFYTYAFPPATAGTAAGEALSPTAAYGFASDRTRSDIRRAQKRFVGIPEGASQSLGILSDAVLALLKDLGDTMADINIVPASDTTMQFTPYVFGREKYTPVGSTKDAYRYYPTQAEQLEHVALITAWIPKTTTRTQTSRQYGRGS